MTRNYFIVYNFSDDAGKSGFGNLNLKRNLLIKSIDDIRSIEDLISKDLQNKFTNPKVAIVNYIKF